MSSEDRDVAVILPFLAAAIAVLYALLTILDHRFLVVSSISLLPEQRSRLPFVFSRWWDVLAGPILAFMALHAMNPRRFHSIQYGMLVGLGIFGGMITGCMMGSLVWNMALCLPVTLLTFVGIQGMSKRGYSSYASSKFHAQWAIAFALCAGFNAWLILPYGFVLGPILAALVSATAILLVSVAWYGVAAIGACFRLLRSLGPTATVS